jgi:uncharacterized membrane protein
MSCHGGESRGLLLAGALVAAYALLNHYALTDAGAGYWALALALAPPLAMATAIARQIAGTAAAMLFALAAAGLAAWAGPRLRAHVDGIYFVQHFGINAALALVFGRTLLAGRQPLVTYFARFTHERLTPAIVAYTRRVTLAWTLFFVACALVSALLFFLGPLAWWSVFANLLTLPLVGLMFVAEHVARRRALPPEEQRSVASVVRAYLAARARARDGTAAELESRHP